ncbi:MAG: WecB/TagA/CpsF family glycosyltransferase, partial [Patescibacteria group bacterium]|nr:WecB/TagA/CpsF family glycosyltransferase [Patescibacteria group bacterium]
VAGGGQEKWIWANLKKLEIPLCLGVGGTFDYIAGKKALAPRILREIGLEWAFRLITQPYRLKRVFTAVPVYISYVYRSKLLQARPYRQSLALCLKNSQGDVLVCRRTKARSNDVLEHWQLPHGGMEAGEGKEQALRREMREELNLPDFDIEKWADDIHRYDWPVPFARFYKNRFRGQMLSVAYATARPEALTKIRPDQFEHDAFKWVKPQDLLTAVHPVQRAFHANRAGFRFGFLWSKNVIPFLLSCMHT